MLQGNALWIHLVVFPWADRIRPRKWPNWLRSSHQTAHPQLPEVSTSSMVVRSRRCEMIKDSAARTCRSRSSRALCLNAILVELPRILIGYGSRPTVISQSEETVLRSEEHTSELQS